MSIANMRKFATVLIAALFTYSPGIRADKRDIRQILENCNAQVEPLQVINGQKNKGQALLDCIGKKLGYELIDIIENVEDESDRPNKNKSN